MRLVAAGLSEAGFKAWLPDHPDERCIVITWRHAQCLLTVTDWGQVEWEYRPWNTVAPDPRWLASLAAVLLTGHAQAPPRRAGEQSHESLSARALAGLDLRSRGLNVALDVVTDTECLEVYAEIIVTVPGSTDAAEVRITDDGTVTWQRDYRAGPASDATPWDDRGSWGVADPGALAGDITATLIRAMRDTAASAEATPVVAGPGTGVR